jgi:hypothetical protein
MTKEEREVMQMALDALHKGDVLCEFVACKILSAELAKPEREPVAQWQKRALYISPPQSRPLLPVDVRAMMETNGYNFASPEEWAEFINGLCHSEIQHRITGDKS